jgi:putative hydrolase of the HAD superfamily
MVVFFDIDGTLLDHDHAERSGATAFFRMHRGLFPQTEESFADLWQATAARHLSRYLANELTFNEQRRARIRDLFALIHGNLGDEACDAIFAMYLRSYERSWIAFADVMPCLDRLEGCVLGVISNGDHEQQTRKLAAIGLEGRFPIVVTSGQVGYAKPRAEIFQEACRRAGRAPAECLYVGDLLDTDARGSRDAGLAGVWLDRKNTGAHTDRLHTIRTLDALPKLVADLAELRGREASERPAVPGSAGTRPHFVDPHPNHQGAARGREPSLAHSQPEAVAGPGCSDEDRRLRADTMRNDR